MTSRSPKIIQQPDGSFSFNLTFKDGRIDNTDLLTARNMALSMTLMGVEAIVCIDAKEPKERSFNGVLWVKDGLINMAVLVPEKVTGPDGELEIVGQTPWTRSEVLDISMYHDLIDMYRLRVEINHKSSQLTTNRIIADLSKS